MIRLFFLLTFLLPSVMYSQIRGKVTDAETGRGLEAVTVSYGEAGTLTGPAGFFDVRLKTDTLHLSVSHLGYQDKNISIPPGKKYIHIELQPLPYNINELVVAAPAFSSRLINSSGSIHLIPHDIIKEINPVNIAEIINFSPGVYMASGNYNTNRLTIRGIGSRTPYGTNRIRAYFDNIPLTNGDGVTNIEDIDASGIGRIEIIKGPASAIYGSGLGGVVRIYPEYNRNDGFNYHLRSEAATFQTYRNTFRAGYRKNNSQISVVYNNSYSDGFRENSEYSRNSLFLLADWFTEAADFSLTMNYINLYGKIPSSLNHDDFINDPQSAASNWLEVEGYEKYQKLLTGLTASFTPFPDWENKVSLFSTIADPYESRPFNILDEHSFNIGLRNLLRRDWERFRILLGTEMFSEDFRWKIFETIEGKQGELLNQNREKRNYINAFVHAEAELLPELKVEGGLNFTALTYKGEIITPVTGDDPDVKSYYPLSPSLGLNYRLHPSLSVYLSANHGFSAPSVEESLMPEGAINPDLKAENGWAYNAGIRGSIAEKLFYNLGLYHIRLQDLLVTRRISEEIFYGINAGEANYSGIEVFMKYIFSGESDPEKEYSLVFSGYASKNKFETFTSDGISYSGNELPGIPGKKLNLLLHLRPFRIWEINMAFNYTGSMYLNDSNSLRYGGYRTLDVKTTFTIPLFSGQPVVRLSGGIRNLFDEQYASMVLVNAPSFGGREPRYYYPGFPRTFFVSLSISGPN